MKEIVFDKRSPPDLLLDIYYPDETVDLHNDFECVQIEVRNDSLFAYLEKGSPDGSYIPNTKYEGGCLEFRAFETEFISDLLSEKLPATIINLSIGEIHFPDPERNKKTLFMLSFTDTAPGNYEIIAAELVIRFW